jgi:hypothetical protein
MVSLPTWGNQFTLDGFLRDQTHRPTGTAFRRATAYHGDQTLFLAIVEHRGCARPLFLIQRPRQAALPVAAPDVADGLCRQRNYVGNTRRGGPLGELQKSQRAQNDTHLLNSGAQQLSKFFLIFGRHFNTQGWTGQALSMGQNISEWNCFLAKTSSGQRPRTDQRRQRAPGADVVMNS